MEQITFYKMSGSGNDFILIDNRQQVVDEHCLTDFIRKTCSRKMSVGADGFILIEKSDQADFKWRFYNSDGSLAEMCGNGARCAARFAYLNGIADAWMNFETQAGIISANVSDEQVRIRMTDPVFNSVGVIDIADTPLPFTSINTGVPHAVVPVSDINAVDVVGLGQQIRFHETFAPSGTNVNFFSPRKDGTVANRTYERGVENETLACGTGCVAVALAMAQTAEARSPVTVIPKSGGPLFIHYKEEQGRFYDIYLEGDARVIYKGELWGDAWKWE